MTIIIITHLFFQNYFKNRRLFQVLRLLLEIVIKKSHQLLEEEAITVICNMAMADYDNFYQTFLPHFLQSILNLNTEQRNSFRSYFNSNTVSFHSSLTFLKFYKTITSLLHN